MIAVLLLAVSVADKQWSTLLACPKVSVPSTTSGTGVVIGVKDGFGYLLTASHVVPPPYDQVELTFTSRESYPQMAWSPKQAEVVARWADPDVALVRFTVGKRNVPVLPLAPAWQRPKAFPVDVLTVGVGSERASTAMRDAIQAKEFVAREQKQPAFFWRTETPPEAGRSGGPLLDGQGRVIGIAVATSGGSGYYAHHDEILAGLKREGYGWLIPAR
jgi:S1-C subfamily serine protease